MSQFTIKFNRKNRESSIAKQSGQNDNVKFKIELIPFAIIILFLVTRFLGLGHIYHQDEYRWASIADPFFGHLLSPHPPLAEFSYKIAGHILGFDYLRTAPFLFSILSLALIYAISLKTAQNKKVAMIAMGIFTVNIYSLIANLQIDIDGAFLPFFILLAYYSFLQILEKGQNGKWWFILFGLAIIGGLLTKLSFLLFIGALIIDQALRFYNLNDGGGIKKVFYRLWPWLAGFSGIIAGFYYFYVINSKIVIEYASHFNSLNFGSRAYFDLAFKVFKSFVWLSPLLALSVFYGLFKKDTFNRYRIWFIYLFLNLVFYLVMFDFTTLTIERYFMFWIMPSVLIGAQVISDIFKNISIPKKTYIIVGIAFVLMLLLILLVPHDVIPLNPKTAYVDRVKLLDFSFLIPFTGGSGPSGFYFSAWYIILSWSIAIISLIVAVYGKKIKSLCLAIFIVFGVGYNILFSAEYLFGSIYGSVDRIAKETIEYVNSDRTIAGVITYYDIGAYYLHLSGKYDSRFYTAPKRNYVPKIEGYRGHYMIVDFPAIDKDGRYWPLISRCPLLKKFQDKKIESYIFDCTSR